MKAGGIVLIVISALLLSASIFFGYFSFRNVGAADRLSSSLPRGGEFVVHIVRTKAQKQLYLSLGLGLPAVLALGGGLVLTRRGRRLV